MEPFPDAVKAAVLLLCPKAKAPLLLAVIILSPSASPPAKEPLVVAEIFAPCAYPKAIEPEPAEVIV